MRALVIYESMYGNTRSVAISVAAGLGGTHEVDLVPVSQATRELIARAGLVVVGGPTHMHGMSRAGSRRMAAEAARKPGSTLDLDPDAGSEGVRGLLAGVSIAGVSTDHALAAAFDTRFSGAPAFTGRASRGIARGLRRRGFRLITTPESFLVSKDNVLLDGESERARSWGAGLGEIAAEAASARAA